MQGKHIDFSIWEPGEALDEEHLAECARCRQEQQVAALVRRQAAAAPRIEAPPFFAARVARLAVEEEARPLYVVMQLAARRLLPALMALLLMVASLAYWNQQAGSQAQLGEEDYQVLSLLFQEEAAAQQMTLDDVFDVLAEVPEGEPVDQPK